MIFSRETIEQLDAYRVRRQQTDRVADYYLGTSAIYDGNYRGWLGVLPYPYPIVNESWTADRVRFFGTFGPVIIPRGSYKCAACSYRSWTTREIGMCALCGNVVEGRTVTMYGNDTRNYSAASRLTALRLWVASLVEDLGDWNAVSVLRPIVDVYALDDDEIAYEDDDDDNREDDDNDDDPCDCDACAHSRGDSPTYTVTPRVDDDGYCLRRPDVQGYGHSDPTAFLGTGPMFVGAELEMCGRVEWWKGLRDTDNVWLEVKDDSTLCRGGAELVTNPIGLDAFHAAAGDTLRTFFNAMSLDDNRTPCGCAGLHFHLSADAFGASGVWGMLWEHAAFRRVLGRMGGRGTRSSWGSWDAIAGNKVNAARTKAAHRDAYYVQQNRYAAVNLQPRNTIELRYMVAAYDWETFATRWELAHALGAFANSPTLRVAVQSPRTAWTTFRGWVADNDYPALVDAFASNASFRRMV